MKCLTVAAALCAATSLWAESPNETATSLPSPPVPAGPRPTATISPLEASPEPTATVTPLPSASPAGTQPQTSNTIAPSPSPTPG
ncbi:MAG: hypothetical protein ABIR38_05780 [Chthoniobacterales bacterium]